MPTELYDLKLGMSDLSGEISIRRRNPHLRISCFVRKAAAVRIPKITCRSGLDLCSDRSVALTGKQRVIFVCESFDRLLWEHIL